MSLAILTTLEATIQQRLDNADTHASYTAQLATSGVERIAQKIGEEGVEVALATVTGSDDALVSESADLMYHLLVALRFRGLSLNAVCDELQRRHSNESG
ncbi:MAG: phosphoribosyl-ATP diphosphatase [Pseudomonadota bacterium]